MRSCSGEKAFEAVSGLFLITLMLLTLLSFPAVTSADNKQDSIIGILYSDRVSMEPAMKVAVEQYWRALACRDFEKAYSLEAPHIKYQLPSAVYQKIFTKFKPFDKIEIVQMRSKDTLYEVVVNRYDCRGNVSGKKDCNIQSILDYWICMDNKWLHVTKSRFLGN